MMIDPYVLTLLRLLRSEVQDLRTAVENCAEAVRESHVVTLQLVDSSSDEYSDDEDEDNSSTASTGT